MRLFMLLLLGLPLLADAAPAFDCAKAEGTAEQLICHDPSLAALDRELAERYPKAIAHFPEREQRQERAIQRGWIKGRNECWKSSDVRACIEQSYRMRITELQIKGGQLEVPAPTYYQCGPALRLEVYFYQGGKLPAAVLNLTEGDDMQQTLAYGERQADATRYTGRNTHLLVQGSRVTLERYGKPSLTCQPG